MKSALTWLITSIHQKRAREACCVHEPDYVCRAKVLITSTGSMRGKKPILLKDIADKGVKLAADQGHQVSPWTEV